jgi:hypothetical protein
MRKVVTIPFGGTETLIIASDNSGGIGMKKGDIVSVPYETTAYYSFRVAVMECIAAGGEPISVVLSNFCGDEAWEKLKNGIQRGLDELHLENVLITGSTESNFLLQQSAIGIMVLGRKLPGKIEVINMNEKSKIAIIGMPLVGNEVIEQDDQIAPLPLFQKTCKLEGVSVWPVGSKGILSELNRMFKNQRFLKDQVISDVDVMKSSGPATCYIVLYQENAETELKKWAGSYFHSVKIIGE